jgi:hypothetical protein
MNLQAALRDLSETMTGADRASTPEARLRLARRILVSRGLEVVKIEPPPNPTLDTVIRSAASAQQTPSRQTFAVLMVHALAVRGLVPTGTTSDVRILIERALPHVLLRSGYPFGGTAYEKRQVLDRLHTKIDEFLEPLQPTFPNWQGLYAG